MAYQDILVAMNTFIGSVSTANSLLGEVSGLQLPTVEELYEEIDAGNGFIDTQFQGKLARMELAFTMRTWNTAPTKRLFAPNTTFIFRGKTNPEDGEGKWYRVTNSGKLFRWAPGEIAPESESSHVYTMSSRSLKVEEADVPAAGASPAWPADAVVDINIDEYKRIIDGTNYTSRMRSALGLA